MNRDPLQQTASGVGRRDFAAWFVAAAALLANLPVLSVDYVFDDHPIVEDGVRVREMQLGTIWATSYWGSPERVGEYRPLVVSSYAIERALLGPEPGHFHVINWLLHALVAVSVLFAGRAIGLGEGAAGVAAALFAVHPLHLDAIAPIVGRAELLAALAMTGGIYFWTRARSAETPSVAALLGLACSILIGAFSKESALAVVPALLVVEWLLFDRSANRSTLVAAGVVVSIVIAAYLLARVAVLGGLLPGAGPSFTSVANPLVSESTGVRLLTAAGILGHYLRLFAWPTPLSPDYSFDSLPVIRSAAELNFLLPLAFLIVLVLLALARVRRHPALAIVLVVFLAPYSIIANAAFPIGTMLAERLFYLPSIGLCWLIGIAVSAVCTRFSGRRLEAPHWIAAITVIPLLALGIASFKRAEAWQNEELLYHAALQTYPRNMGMWLTLGEIAIRKGRFDLGVERMGHVIEIVPDFPKAWSDRGTMLAALGRTEAARADLRHALELDPDNLLTLENLAIVERELGNHGEAGELERRAVELRTRHESERARRPGG